MIKAVIFDCYGVLAANASDVAFEMLGGDLIAHRRRIDEIYLQFDLGIMNRAESHAQMAELVEVSAERWEQAINEAHGVNGVLVEFAKDLNVKRSILSNIGRESFDRLLNKVDFSFFDDMVLSGDVGMVKPDARIFELAAARLEVEPEECILVDDMIANVEAAKRAGMVGVHYQSSAETIKALKVLLGA